MTEYDDMVSLCLCTVHMFCYVCSLHSYFLKMKTKYNWKTCSSLGAIAKCDVFCTQHLCSELEVMF